MALNTSGSAAPIPTVSATTYTVTVKVLDTAQLVFLKESNYAVRLGTPPKAEAYVEGITSLELTTPAETGGNPNKPKIVEWADSIDSTTLSFKLSSAGSKWYWVGWRLPTPLKEASDFTSEMIRPIKPGSIYTVNNQTDAPEMTDLAEPMKTWLGKEYFAFKNSFAARAVIYQTDQGNTAQPDTPAQLPKPSVSKVWFPGTGRVRVKRLDTISVWLEILPDPTADEEVDSGDQTRKVDIVFKEGVKDSAVNFTSAGVLVAA